jgi:hypothetical protein
MVQLTTDRVPESAQNMHDITLVYLLIDIIPPSGCIAG